MASLTQLTTIITTVLLAIIGVLWRNYNKEGICFDIWEALTSIRSDRQSIEDIDNNVQQLCDLVKDDLKPKVEKLDENQQQIMKQQKENTEQLQKNTEQLDINSRIIYNSHYKDIDNPELQKKFKRKTVGKKDLTDVMTNLRENQKDDQDKHIK